LSAERLRAAAVAFMGVFLFVLPFTSSVALRNVALTAAALCALAWLARSRVDWRTRMPPRRLWLPIACFSAWSIVSVAWSVDPAYSLSELRPGLLPTLGAFLLFCAVTDDYTDLDRFALWLGAGLAVLALGAIAQQVVNGEWDPSRWHGDVGSYSTHIVLTLPMLAWVWLRLRSSWPRLAVLATGLATLVVTFWTDNRIVWASLAAMAAVAAFFAIRSGAIHDRRRLAAIAFLVVATLGGVFVMAIQQRQETKHQPELIEDPRLAIWAFAGARIAESPWIGHGYGRGILRQSWRDAVRGPQNPLHWHGHNLVVNVALQLGAVGLALFVWMWVAMVRELARGLRSAPPLRWSAALGITLLVGFALKNMTDDFFVRHVAILVWSLLGALLAVQRATTARQPAREGLIYSRGVRRVDFGGDSRRESDAR